ncbi:hypothetical protein B0T14DRAFT_339188 [Immersiella caudata]|uniref:Uncharacterized protein n=1 Tax=Immersiella caudata TaxID=314043 RepID=A0AA39WC72_9PEZI|nr:hypothetical protein B0T14DRAFT_339188 [Immersiella caudata]
MQVEGLESLQRKEVGGAKLVGSHDVIKETRGSRLQGKLRQGLRRGLRPTPQGRSQIHRSDGGTTHRIGIAHNGACLSVAGRWASRIADLGVSRQLGRCPPLGVIFAVTASAAHPNTSGLGASARTVTAPPAVFAPLGLPPVEPRLAAATRERSRDECFGLPVLMAAGVFNFLWGVGVKMRADGRQWMACRHRLWASTWRAILPGTQAEGDFSPESSCRRSTWSAHFSRCVRRQGRAKAWKEGQRWPSRTGTKNAAIRARSCYDVVWNGGSC